MNARVLLVEDEELVGTMVRMNLESAGYQVTWTRDGEQAVAAIGRQPFDLLLLDISLPGQDGLDVLAEIRRREILTPVMMLTARSEVSTKVEALRAGADDYLPKPFDVAEMLARVEALVRRSRADRQLPADHLIRFGNYSINLETREAITNEGEIVLGEKEAAILALLVKAQGRPLLRSDILEEVWGMDVSPTERTVDNFILRLRKLFEPDADNPCHIITVRGTGYRFEP
jgi:two-component system, OmpR family, alkaline phosphatase synthesis response regulator PhoP